MKSLDKKDLPKLIAMIVVAIGLFAYAIVQFSAASNTGTARAADATKKQGDSTVGAKPDQTGQVGSAVTAAEDETGQTGMPWDPRLIGFPSGGRDPFTPTGVAAEKDTEAPQPRIAPSVAAVPAPTGPDGPNADGRFAQLLGLNRMNPGRSGLPSDASRPSGATGAMVLPPPPPPAFIVTGVVMGDSNAGDNRNIAILRGASGPGGEDRRFVTVGDEVGNGFVVAAVHDMGVDLKERNGSRHVTLKLGGDPKLPEQRGNAASPIQQMPVAPQQQPTAQVP